MGAVIMDYENTKAMIEARRKQWKEQAEQVRSLQAERPSANALEPIVKRPSANALEPIVIALDACVTACEVILQDLETAYDIFSHQQ